MKRLVAAFIISVSSLLPLAHNAASQQQEQFTQIIVDEGQPLKRLTYEQARSIFTLGVTRWDNGTPIVVIMLEDKNPLQRRFLWEKLGITTARYKEIVDAKVQAGKRAPLIVRSDTEMIERVSKVDGAIGFVRSDAYIQTGRGIKLIRLQ